MFFVLFSSLHVFYFRQFDLLVQYLVIYVHSLTGGSTAPQAAPVDEEDDDDEGEGDGDGEGSSDEEDTDLPQNGE